MFEISIEVFEISTEMFEISNDMDEIFTKLFGILNIKDFNINF